MEILENRHGAVTVLKPVGPLVGPEGDRFKSHVQEVMGRSLGRFVVDASGIPLIDSRGLEVLVELASDLGESGQALRLCGCGETLREVMEVTDLSGYFEHYTDVNTAVRSFL